MLENDDILQKEAADVLRNVKEWKSSNKDKLTGKMRINYKWRHAEKDL